VTGIPFALGHALVRSLRRPGALILWVGAVGLALFSGMALLLLPARGTPRDTAVEAFLVARLSPLPPEERIAQLGAEILSMVGVAQVAYRFPGETDPVPISGRSVVVRLSSPAARSEVERRLKLLAEVVGVEYAQRAAAGAQVPPASRIVAVGALVVALVLALTVGQRGAATAGRVWGEELGLLRTVGWGEGLLRLPFLALGGAVGLLATGLFLAVVWALWMWGTAVPALVAFLPYFPRVWPTLLLLGGPVGVALGLVGAGLGALDLPDHS